MKSFYLYFIRLILVIFILSFFGCVSQMERDAHFVNGHRYIPMLKIYIEKDSTIHQNLKDTYYKGLDTWLELIDTKK